MPLIAALALALLAGPLPAQTSSEALLQRACTPCHRLDVVRAQKLSRQEWSLELDKMEAMGAKLYNRRILLNYLARNFGSR